MTDGGPAFPCDMPGQSHGKAGPTRHYFSGMSMLDYFAANAMHAMLNNDIRREEMATVSNIARDAYKMANAMMEARQFAAQHESKERP